MLREKVGEMNDAMNARTEGCNEHPMFKLKESAFTIGNWTQSGY
jgi:hypothetical protein